jgi:predicted amidohydrolase
LVTERALENAITIAYANYCGTESDLTYSGNSIIASTDGNPLALAGGSETLLITSLPKSKVKNVIHLSTQERDLRIINNC